jgi:hypothetical protein
MPLLLSTTRRAVWSASHVSKQQPYQPHLTTIRLQRALRQQGLGGELAHPRQRRRCSNSYSTAKAQGLRRWKHVIGRRVHLRAIALVPASSAIIPS